MEDDLLDDDAYHDDDVTRSILTIPDIFQTESGGHNETGNDKYPTYPLKASSDITNCYKSEKASVHLSSGSGKASTVIKYQLRQS